MMAMGPKIEDIQAEKEKEFLDKNYLSDELQFHSKVQEKAIKVYELVKSQVLSNKDQFMKKKSHIFGGVNSN